MARHEIIATLRSAMPELRREFHVRNVAIFGSVAREQDTAASDIDLLVRFEPDAPVSLFTISGLSLRLTRLLGRNVDIIEDHPRLRPDFRTFIERDLCRVA